MELGQAYLMLENSQMANNDWMDEHQPGETMKDWRGNFQRCWACGARRAVRPMGVGLWDKGNHCGSQPETPAPVPAQRTQQELLDDLFKAD